MNALVLGGSGGIGQAFIDYLLKQDKTQRIHATFYQHHPGVHDERVCWHKVDVTQDSAIKDLCSQFDEIELCINAVGMLHDQAHLPEKSARQIDPDFFTRSVLINALPSLLLARHLSPHFKHQRPAHFAVVSARIGSIEENRLGGWYSYRASKAALNMALKTLSIEWKRSLPNVIVSALHPGTTDTRLSRPFQKNVPSHDLFHPSKSVTSMMQVIDNLTPGQSGNFWSFDGQKLPW
ncbi:MAG: SDR family NAD(P)-dependent oxidoreductase [Gammaproteobacteria bacterium]|nr:SDR family NAD(P)-dependent oxidoreductase [Gammaproteobacteria bacterium]